MAVSALPDLVRIGLFPLALCAAIACDLAWRIIPNLVVVALLAGFAALAVAMPVPDLAERLMVSGLVTALGFALFAHDIIGAGDAKLAGALMLWLDPLQVPAFMLICAVIAALLTLAATLAARRSVPPRAAALLAGATQALPYGVALAGAGLLLQPYSSLAG